MVLKKAYFLDADYIVKKGVTYVRLLVKGKKTTYLYYRFDPYFYAEAPEASIADVEKISTRRKNGEITKVTRVEKCELHIAGKKKQVLKVFCQSPSDVPVIKSATPFPCYEYNILFGRRFMLDMQIAPFAVLHYEREGRIISKIKKIENSTSRLPELNVLAFDIETYNPMGASREKKDPAIMISYAGKHKAVLTFKHAKKDYAVTLKDEKEMLEKFVEAIGKENPDILYGYNSGVFDLPYLQARADALGVKLNLGRGKTGMRPIRKGMVNGMKINGRIHVDLYPMVRFFGFIGMIKSPDFTLEKVYESVIGKKKLMVVRKDIWQMWDSNEIDDLAEYSLMDSVITKELGDNYLHLQIELSNITKMPLFDTVLSTSGQLVESVLMFQSVAENMVIPSRPSDSIIKERMLSPIQGAFVKLPAPGIYENIAVMDFRGLYPSIIASYNIDPYTIIDDKENGGNVGNEDVHVAPSGVKFSKTAHGLIPKIVAWLLDYRSAIKKEMKSHGKESTEYKQLDARSWALKIVTNSIYGYLAYPRSRWYSRECGEATTAYGRKHIQETIAKAEKHGFHVLYGDTDSIFFLYKNKEDVLKFLHDINKDLPEKMELELEGFYPRGVFVGKKQASASAAAKGAKKKYALLGEDGRIKIRGFELVRRDWSKIAKQAQFAVLETILREGSKEKAVKIVRDTIERLRKGEVKMEELAIETQLSKDADSYEVKSPELAAAEKAKARGVPMEKGSIISFVITKKGKTISEKAEPLQFANDYDVDYYIDHQVLPAVMKILKELGYDEYALKMGGKQKGLDAFFE